MARGKHLFPFRTEPLSPSAPMVLGSQGPGRVGRRRFFIYVVVNQRSVWMHGVIKYFRANPQVFVLLVICVVLGLGTFIAVLVALATAPTDQTTGEPSGLILGAHAALTTLRTAFPGA